MDVRPVDQWMQIFERLPASDIRIPVEEFVANRIIGDLVGYRHNSKDRQHDVSELTNAMIAYARLLDKHGVKA